MKIKYELIIYWSEIDQAFIVEIPELPGCAADGETYQQAVQNAEVVIREWIETAQELGRSVPEPRGRLLFARISSLEKLRVIGWVESKKLSITFL